LDLQQWGRESATLQQEGGGSSTQQGRCTDGQLGLKPEGRMEGKRCSSAAEGWRVGVRTEEVRESGGEV